ncbi:MAG: acetolactate synthase large subunit, partial [Pseudomonadota bacterium]
RGNLDMLVWCRDQGCPWDGVECAAAAASKGHTHVIQWCHEQGAAFMAGVHGRLTGQPCVCLGTLGPGATNLLTGVADADMDNAPLIVITGQAGADRLHKESHQVMDVGALFAPVVKWSVTIRAPETIPEIVRKAVRLARGEKPGAVHIELPEDVAGRTTDAGPLAPRRFRRPGPDPDALHDAWSRIRGARRPIIVAGNGAVRSRASQALRAFCEVTGIGALSTFMGKGALDLDDPRCLFSIGLQQRDHAALAIAAADLVIAVGYDLVEYPPALWNPQGETPVVHVDFDPAEIDRCYAPAAEIVGDVAAAVQALTEAARRDGPGEWDFSGQARLRETMLAEFAAHADDDAPRVKPQKAVWEVRRALGPDDVLLCGVGAHKMWVGRHYHCHAPNTCLIPNGFCAMGMPLPGALAAARALPGRRILALCGDGDFMMNVQEMETISRLGADVTAMVWEDGGYGLISWKQDETFGRHTDLSFGSPDWAALGQAFGWRVWQVEGSTALRDDLAAALAHPGPSLVVVPIDYRENAKLSERLGALETTL